MSCELGCLLKDVSLLNKTSANKLPSSESNKDSIKKYCGEEGRRRRRRRWRRREEKVEEWLTSAKIYLIKNAAKGQHWATTGQFLKFF